MPRLPIAIFLTVFASIAAPAQQPSLSQSVEAQLPALDETYKNFHRNPELSHHEEHTSATLAAELRKLGYTVTEHVGRYADGSQAWGVVAILQNGPGPRLLLRTDLDALPVEEKTGVDYASHAKSVNADGQPTGVMHACGHDIHMTALLGVARELATRKSQWHGTIMLIGQPSEETIDGARAMLADRLYDRFGKPDFILGEHDASNIAVGDVAVKSGPLLASSTSVDVVMRGIGSHGAHPDAGKDPIVMAAEFILLAQTIVSRQTDPQEPAVLTVGMIHGGLKRNIIPEEVKMELTLRAYSEPVRLNLIEGIKRTANGVAIAYGVPADRMPIVTVSETEVTPPTINDPAFAERMSAVAAAALGQEHVVTIRSEMGSEDFGLFSLGGAIPSVFVRLGAVDRAKLADSHKTGVPLPGPHSPLFAPVYEPTLRTGVITMTALSLDVLK